MKKIRFFTLFLLISATLTHFVYAELPEIITTCVRQVAPGVIQRTMEAPSKPWMIYVLEMDIHNPSLIIRAIDGGGLQKPSVMASAKEATNYRLVGATNGDFFEPDYTSTNAGVVDGELTKLEKLSVDNPVYWSALSIGDNNMPNISCNKFEGEIFINGNNLSVDDINSSRGTNELLFYNHFKGNSTGTSSGVEVQIRPVNGWKVNENMPCIMEGKSSSGNMSLGTGSAVLSGNGTAATFLNDNYNLGNTVDVLLMMRAFEDLSQSGVSFNYLDLVQPLKHLIGGFPMFIRNGENYATDGYRNENGGGSFNTDLHPRTAAGFNEDTTKMYFVVVDGRQSESIGINLIDLADIMIDLGAWRAMNFDGGGSSVMIVGDDIVNSPSDGYERSVRNCYAIYSTAPEEALSIAQIELDTMRIYRNQSFSFMVSGWDANYNPKSIANWGEVQLNCSPSLGIIQGERGNYTFMASAEGTNGYVYVDLNGNITDSMYVKTISLDPIIISPANALTDTIKTIQYNIMGINEEGDTISVSNSVFEYSVVDTTIGTINANGLFQGKSVGSTKIYVHYGTQCDSTNVTVYLGEGECSLDPMENLNGWTLKGYNLDTLNTGISIVDRADGLNGSKAIKIDYKTIESGKIYINKDIEVPGIPQLIMFDVLSDGLNHRMYVQLEDALGKSLTIYQSGYVNNADNYETLYMNASAIEAVYPIKIKNIYIRLQSGVQEGTLYLDDLRMSYPGNTAIHYEDPLNAIKENFILHSAYPNPFNPSVNIKYELGSDMHTLLEIFNVRGELIEILVDEVQQSGLYRVNWTPRTHSSGCYIYKLQVAGQQEIGKMLYLK